MRTMIIRSGLLVALLATVAYAQTGIILPPSGSYYHHASTAEEGAARGMADLVRSSGQANLLNSQAASQWEDARTKNLDNRLKATYTYFEMRRINREARAAEQMPRPTTEQLFRWAKESAPSRLGPYELDPLTGEIAWPRVLMTEAFAQERKLVSSGFAARAEHRLTADLHTLLEEYTSGMREHLRDEIKNFETSEYLAGAKLLDGLLYELRFPPG